METETGRTRLSAREIFDLVREDLERVEKAIMSNRCFGRDGHHDRRTCMRVRKRLRPALLLLCARFSGGVATPHSIGRGLEMIHAATLVHDDVIDVAETRRGRPSANVQWATTLRSGRRLALHAGVSGGAAERNFHILDLLISLTQMMVEGELIQLDRIGRIGITSGLYGGCRPQDACLFSAAPNSRGVCRCGYPGGKKLGEFAWNLGMAFQLIDDMLDFTSREQTLGTVGGDLKEGKVTLPARLCARNALAAERGQVEVVLGDAPTILLRFDEIYSMIERRGGIQRTRERAQQFTDRARTGSRIPTALSARALHC